MSSNAALQARRTAAVPRGDRHRLSGLCRARRRLGTLGRRRQALHRFRRRHRRAQHRPPPSESDRGGEKQLDAFTHTAFQIVPYEPYIALCERLNTLAPFRARRRRSSSRPAPKRSRTRSRSPAPRPGAPMSSPSPAPSTAARCCLGAHRQGRALQEEVRAVAGAVSTTCRSRCRSTASPVADSLHALDYLFRADVDPVNVAAIIIEPVQGEGGFHPAPTELLEGAAQDLRPARHPADRRRDPDRLRAHRQDVRHRAFRRRARSHHRGQSLAGGFPLSGVVGKAAIMDAPGAGRPRRHLCRQPGRLRGGARRARRDRGGEADRARQQARRADEGRLAPSPSATTRSPMSAIRGPGAMVAFDMVKKRGGEEPDADATKRVTAAALPKGWCCCPAASTPTPSAS